MYTPRPEGRSDRGGFFAGFRGNFRTAPGTRSKIPQPALWRGFAEDFEAAVGRCGGVGPVSFPDLAPGLHEEESGVEEVPDFADGFVACGEPVG